MAVPVVMAALKTIGIAVADNVAVGACMGFGTCAGAQAYQKLNKEIKTNDKLIGIRTAFDHFRGIYR